MKDFHPKDYPAGEAMVPHGMSVALTAPEAFRFTFDASPERHVRVAQLLAPDAGQPADAAEFLPTVLADLMRDIDIPNGVGAVGFDEGDIPDLVEGTMKQQRLLATCPKEVTEDDIAGIFGGRCRCGDQPARTAGARADPAQVNPGGRRLRDLASSDDLAVHGRLCTHERDCPAAAPGGSRDVHALVGGDRAEQRAPSGDQG